MADAMMPGAMPPVSTDPSIDQLAAFEQMRQQVSPTEFNQEMLATAEEADPLAVAEFRKELSALEVAPEVIDMLNTMVDEVLADPGSYPAIRQRYLEQGVDEEMLPEAFDAGMFAALNMALDELRGPGTMAPPQAFAKGGIASLKPMAREMAAAGRNGDTVLAHISPVEARMLRRYGGSGTTNPVTGLPEYSLKKVFKSIGKAVKKFASSTVGKIVTTVALGFFLGPAAAGVLGASSPAAVAAISGFVGGAGSTMLAGGNLKDALKAGAIGGLTAGATTAAFRGADAFKPAPPPATSQLQAAQQAMQQGTALPDLMATSDALAMAPLEQQVRQGVQANMAAPTAGGIDFSTGQYTPPGIGAGQARTALSYTPPPLAGAPAPGAYSTPTLSQGVGSLPSAQVQQAVAQRVAPPASTGAGTSTSAGTSSNVPGFMESVKGVVGPDRTLAQRASSLGDVFFPGEDAGFLRKYGPMTGLGLAALGATGGFEAEEGQIPPGFEGMMGGQGRTGVELLAQYPEQYGIRMGPIQTVSSMPYATPERLFSASTPRRAAKGGVMSLDDYPRKNGEINGPGTGTSDDIPAMLSDGEFVFTAKSVRAMGDGSRRKGAKRMYALMRKLEGRANG
jgi:hypothetical protein